MECRAKTCHKQADEGVKLCSSCREAIRRWKRANPERVRTQSAAQHLKRRYGLTVERYGEMLKEQGGVCRICLRPETARVASGETKPLAVDHCHETGRVRSLLCNNCNTAVGFLESRRDLIDSMLEYINATWE